MAAIVYQFRLRVTVECDPDREIPHWQQPHEVVRPNVIVAPTGPLIVPALAGGDTQPVLSLVVPTLNERDNIADFLAAVRHNLDQALPGRYEVIVVDDDSADRTWEIAARLCARTSPHCAWCDARTKAAWRWR